MKATGIVAEYNPFHSGHKYHIEKTKELTSRPVVAVMSGNFVQRGECAVFDKSVRAAAALKNGADLIFELPTPWALSSAEKFADGAIYLLNSTGICDYVSFGSESGDTDKIKKVSSALLSLDGNAIKKYMNRGESYPSARQKALEEIIGKDYSSVLSSPNDLLAVEYVKSIIKNNYPLTPVTVKRFGAEHDSVEKKDNIMSASAIRNEIKLANDYYDFVPDNAAELYSCNPTFNIKKLETSILSHLRRKSAEDFTAYPDVSEGLEFRIYDAVRNSKDLDELYSSIKTKRYAHSRIRRIIMSAFLESNRTYTLTPPPYLRVLGFTDNGRTLLKQMKKTSSLPVITRYGDVNSLSDEGKRLFGLECTATDLFSLGFSPALKCGNEMRREIIYYPHTDL